MAVYLSMQLQKPLLIEGPAGVGKTEIAKVMARALDTDLIRLQCYEGLDASHALYKSIDLLTSASTTSRIRLRRGRL